MTALATVVDLAGAHNMLLLIRRSVHVATVELGKGPSWFWRELSRTARVGGRVN